MRVDIPVPKNVLLVDDHKPFRDSLAKILEGKGLRVFSANDGEEALDTLRKEEIHLVLTDLKMPRMDGVELLKVAKTIRPEVEVILITGYGTVDTAVTAMKDGAYDYIQKPFKPQEILKLVRKAIEKQSLVLENRILQERIKDFQKVEKIVGRSPAMRRVLEIVAQVAPSLATILIQGESGTGKEVIAQAIHDLSPRVNKPFIKVSCAALPETLLEAELFGYERGAFTGAIARKEGVFKLADGGTLFLDEVSEMSVPLQVKLLRVLETGTFRRVGGVEDIHVDVRVVAATNRDLRQMVDKNLFRQDLYYRLNVFPIVLPPLRERPSDITILVGHFIEKLHRDAGGRIPAIAKEASDLLHAYRWPGNVRELENVIERALILSGGDEILPEHLPLEVQPFERPSTAASAAGSDAGDLTFREAKNEFEKQYLETLLARHKGSVAPAAIAAGMSRAHFYELIKKYHIDLDRYTR